MQVLHTSPKALLKWRAILFLNLLICLILAVCNCSSFDLIPSDSLIQRLKNRGPVLVSPDNPYLAANLLLTQESANSKELKGFLDTKGNPSALLVTQDFLNPARIKLFYAEKSEQYDLELLRGIWVINGPRPIQDQEANNLLTGAIKSESKSERSETRVIQNQQAYASQELEPLFNEQDQVTDKKNKTSSAPEIDSISNQPSVSDQISELKSNNKEGIDALISKYSVSAAETTPRGDIVHFVSSEQETLKMICYWYTKSELTLSRIARANKLNANATLAPGDQIVIPAELSKNKMRLTEEAVNQLSRMALKQKHEI